MATYLECRDDLQFQHGPIENLSSIDTWHDVHSLPIAISNQLDLLVIALNNILYVYKCSKYTSALITKSRDLSKGEYEIEKSKVTNLLLSSDILAVSVSKKGTLLVYELDKGEAGVLELQNLTKPAVKLPDLKHFSWSGDRLLCFHPKDNNKLSIYNFEDYDGKGDIPEIIECKTPDLSADIHISGLDVLHSQSFWAVGHSNPAFFFTITSEGNVSENFTVSVDQENSEFKLVGICPVSSNKVLTALLVKNDSSIDSVVSLYSITKPTEITKHFTVENELFIQDENFGESLSDPFNGAVKFLNFEPLGIIFAIGSHTSQSLILGYGEFWKNQWNVLEMDEGCSLEVSDSLNCPRGIAISTTFKETLYRRHAQVDTPPLVNPPLVILAQRDCTLAMHYIVSPIKISPIKTTPILIKQELEETKVIDTNDDQDNEVDLIESDRRSSLVEKFFLEGVNSGDGLPSYERGARDTLIEALSQAFTLVDQSLDGLDELSASGIEFISPESDVKISENDPPKPLREDYNLTHIHDLIAKFVCLVTKQFYSPPLEIQKSIIELESKLRARVRWLRNPYTRCNDFLFHHFLDETISSTLTYTDYLLEPGFFHTQTSLRPSPELSSLVPIIEDLRLTHPASSAGSESPKFEGVIKTPRSGDGSNTVENVKLCKEIKFGEQTNSFTNDNITTQIPLIREDVIDEIMGKTCLIKTPVVMGFQNLFRHNEQQSKFRRDITDRIRKGHQINDFRNIDKNVVRKNWAKHGVFPLVKTHSIGSIKFGEWSAVKFRAEKAARAAQARLEAEAEELARKAELERLEKERMEREREEREREREERERERARIEKEKAEKEKAEKAERERARVERVEEEKARRERERIEREERAKAELELLERLRIEREKLEKGVAPTVTKEAESTQSSTESTELQTTTELPKEDSDVPEVSDASAKEAQTVNVGAAIQMFERSISKTEKSPTVKQNQPLVKADFSAMLMDSSQNGGSAFRRQTYGFNESSSLTKTLQNPDSKPSSQPTTSFGGFSSFATSGGSLTDIAQKASGSGFSDYCTPGSFGSFGSFGASAFSTGTGIKGFTDTGFGQGGGFKGFTSSPGGFGEGGSKTFTKNTDNQQNKSGSVEGDLWSKPRMANPLN